MTVKPSPDFVRGVREARRLYAEAWMRATGERIDEVLFTDGFLEARARELVTGTPTERGESDE